MKGTVAGRCVASLLLAGVLGAALPHVRPAYAHSWYPPRCCTGQDCKKVDRIDRLPDGGMIMYFGTFDVQVPAGFRQMPSQDADAHVCVYRNSIGRLVPRCVFMPAGV
jgi:hypothetical protein